MVNSNTSGCSPGRGFSGTPHSKRSGPTGENQRMPQPIDNDNIASTIAGQRNSGFPVAELADGELIDVFRDLFALPVNDCCMQFVVAGFGGRPLRIAEPHGRVADCVDPDGTRFAVFAPPAAAPGLRPPINGALNGDVSYLTFNVVNSAASRAFYGAVLGWEFTSGRVDDGWQVSDIAPMSGLSGGHELAAVVPMWRVNDIADAVDRVRRAGGTAADPEQQPYGLSSECVDDQGMRFYLGQH